MNHKRHPLDIKWFNGSKTSWATASGEEVSRNMMGAGRRNDLSWLVIPKQMETAALDKKKQRMEILKYMVMVCDGSSARIGSKGETWCI